MKLSLLAAAMLLLAPAASADFTVTGKFEYQDRVYTYSGGFTNNQPFVPVRQARVSVVDSVNGTTYATSSTDENGNYSLQVSGSSNKNILVRCFARSDVFGNNRLRVTNSGTSVYSVSSQAFPNHSGTQDLNVGTVQALKLTSGGFQGGPFNMLDQMVWGIQYIKAQGGANPTSNLRMRWPGGSGSFASGSTATMADDDGFDDMVILHEFGHVVHNVYSDSDSPGGSHSFGQSDQDPRLSFGEGWASFFGGAVRQFAGINDPGFYMDADGNGSTGSGTIQLRMRYETGSPFTNSTGGEADEGAVFCVLWDLVDRADTDDNSPGVDDDALDGSILFNGQTADFAQWQDFTGPAKSAANVTIRNLWDGWFTPVNHGQQALLEDNFDNWSMRFYEDSLEPNNSVATASPLAPGTNWGSTRTLYSASSAAGAPGHGDDDYYSVNLTSGAVFDVETRYPGGVGDAKTYVDPRFEILRPNGSLFASDNDSGTGRNAKRTDLIADATGDWIVRVFSTHSYRRTGSYQVRVNVTGGPQPASTITSVLPSQVSPVVADGGTTITLNGFGFTGATQVKIDNVTLLASAFHFFVQGDTQIVFLMPKFDKLGPLDIGVTTPGGLATGVLQVVANSTPVVDMKSSLPASIIQSGGLAVSVGGNPGDFVFITASPEQLPTNIAGVADLAIGNQNASLFILANVLIGPSGSVDLNFPLSGLPSGLNIHMQTAVFLVAQSYALPATTSNVQTGVILF